MKHLYIIVILLFTFSATAQVGINNTDPKAQMDISAGATPSEKDGLLIPRLDEYPTGVSADQNGMLVFITGDGAPTKGFYYWDAASGGSWVSVTGAGGATLDEAYDFGGAGNGRTITATDGAVTIAGGDGFLVEGEFGSGDVITTTGTGSRMFFNPRKGAFRAGRAQDNFWDDASVGIGSAAFGFRNQAFGENSIAIGEFSFATGQHSFAGGLSSNATGYGSFAFGNAILASGIESVAYGNNSTASGQLSFATGAATTASGQLSFVGGLQSTASGDYSFAFGNGAEASGDNSTALGLGTIASGNNSIAFGSSTEASGTKSTALGDGAIASGFKSIAFGDDALASGSRSVSIGRSTQASNYEAFAFGHSSNATGEQSTSFGFGTTASGSTSTAFGSNTTASGGYSTAFGINTTASASSTTAFGANTSATRNNSLSAGEGAIASGRTSFALGVFVNAPSYNETSLGAYSTIYTPVSIDIPETTDRLFSIGNGIDNSNRSNALTIYKNGLMNINDEYNMPLIDGTTGQVMTTDGSGNVTFNTVVGDGTGTDDQNLITPSLSGTTLNLGIENGNSTSVNLSSLVDDGDWVPVGSDIERQSGNVYIGNDAATNNDLYISDRIIDWDSPAYYIDPDDTSRMDEIRLDPGSINDPSLRFGAPETGFFAPVVNTTAYSSLGFERFRIQLDGELSLGTSTPSDYLLSVNTNSNRDQIRIGDDSSSGPGLDVMVIDHDSDGGNGLSINMNSGNSAHTKSAFSATTVASLGNMAVDLANFETGTDKKYGVKSVIPENTLAANVYGVYSESSGINSYSGYFLGNVAIGTSETDTYILPTSRGTNNQIIQTNATGETTWVNPSTVFTDTDNQNLTTPTLSGTTLNLNIENGTGTSINLAGLQDGMGTDDQDLNLSGTTLSIENGNNVDLTNFNGDIRTVNAGPGLSGGGFTGNVTLTALANNGLNVNVGADRIQLGGALTQDTEITFGTRDIRWNLDNTGDFIIQDNGVDHFEVSSNGNIFFGGTTFWREGSTGGTTIATMESAANAATLSLRNNGSTTTRFRANGNSYFNGGKLAIGNTNPTGYLDISAPSNELQPHVKITTESGNFGRIAFDSDNVTNGSTWTLKSLNSVSEQFNEFSLSYIEDGISEREIIFARGNKQVGINAPPQIDFHVTHGFGTNDTGFRLQNDSNGAYWTFNSINNGNLHLYSSESGNSLVGSFNGTSGGYTALSDRRMKKNFKKLHFNWSKFLELQPLTYNFKSDTTLKSYIGLIAQDVDKIYPELIEYDKEQDIYKMDYSASGVIAIKAVQELKNEVTTLEEKVTTLSSENLKLQEQLAKFETLEARLSALENNSNTFGNVNDINPKASGPKEK